jgi:opacity protein-like surface antigen
LTGLLIINSVQGAEKIMTRVSVVLFIVAIIFLQTVPAMAASTTDTPNLRNMEVYYISLKGGMTAFSDISYNAFGGDPDQGDPTATLGAGVEGAVAFGWAFSDGRVELEGGYYKSDVETIAGTSVTGIEYTMATLMVNGYYDIEIHKKWRPYLGAGIGAANILVDTPGDQDDAYAIAYKLGGGLALDLSRRVSLDLGYMYLFTSDFSLTIPDGEFVEGIAGHTVTAGMRFLLY